MIKADELRIGNYVMADNAKIWAEEYNGTIVKVDIDEFKDIYFNDNYYSPIPLTTELLEKCGFEKYTENTGAPINEDIQYWGSQFVDVFFDNYGGLILKDYHININRPRYMHQLQNLYFALTGTELEISL